MPARPSLKAPAAGGAVAADASKPSTPAAGGVTDQELSALVTPASSVASSGSPTPKGSTMHEALARANVERLEKQWAMTEAHNGEMIDLVLPPSPVPSVRRLQPRSRIRSKLSEDTPVTPATVADAPESAEDESSRRDSFEKLYVEPAAVVPSKLKLALGIANAGPLIFEVIMAFYLQFYLLEQACVGPYLIGAIHIICGVVVTLCDIFLFGALTGRGVFSGNALLAKGGRPLTLLLAPAVLAGGHFLVYSHHVVLQVHDSEYSKLFYFMPIICVCAVASSAIRAVVSTLNNSLSPDYDERTSIASYRVGWSNALALVALGVHCAVVRLSRADLLGSDITVAVQVDANTTLTNVVPNTYKGFEVSGYVIAASIAATGWFAYYHLDLPINSAEKSPDPAPGRPATNAAAWYALKASKPFLWLIAATFCGTVAMVLFEANLIMYQIYRIGKVTDFLQIVLTNQVTTILFMPFYCWMMWRTSKHTAYYRAGFVMATAFFILFFLKDGGFIAWHVALFSGFVGSASSVVTLIPSAMLPSVADEDYIRTRLQRRPLMFEGMFGIVQKIGVYFGFAISSFALGYAEYVNPPNTCHATVQEDDLNKDVFVVATIRTLMAAVPAGLILFSAFCVMSNPNTKNVEVDLISTRVRRRSISRHAAASADQAELETIIRNGSSALSPTLPKVDETRTSGDVAVVTAAAASGEA